MSHTVRVPYQPWAERERMHRLQLVLGTVLGILVGTVGFAVARSAVGFVRDDLPTQAEVAETLSELPGRELPREWRWERDAIEFDHMYRRKEEPRLDWIRERGDR